MHCWQCQASVPGLVCGACGALQPPDPEADHFAVLGLSRRFDQDAEDISKRHRARQRKVHPDRFTNDGPRARRLARQGQLTPLRRLTALDVRKPGNDRDVEIVHTEETGGRPGMVWFWRQVVSSSTVTGR